jgi:hypothetical protein
LQNRVLFSTIFWRMIYWPFFAGICKMCLHKIGSPRAAFQSVPLCQGRVMPHTHTYARATQQLGEMQNAHSDLVFREEFSRSS